MMIILLENLTAEESKTFGLVLSATGIPYGTGTAENGQVLYVENDRYHDAKRAITAYVNENHDMACDLSFRRQPFRKTYSAVVVASALVLIHILVTNLWDPNEVFQTYGASAFRILRGELYRTVTALTLHSGPMHLTTNLVGLAVFGTALCGIVGWGVGWSLILISGVLGNLLNAFFYQTGHLAVGASTAVFGAVGLVAVEQVLWKLKAGGPKGRAWLPLGGGLALLAFMGASQQTDLMGHFFGFAAGGALSVIYTTFVHRTLSVRYQTVGALLALGMIGGAWLRPLF